MRLLDLLSFADKIVPGGAGIDGEREEDEEDEEGEEDQDDLDASLLSDEQVSPSPPVILAR